MLARVRWRCGQRQNKHADEFRNKDSGNCYARGYLDLLRGQKVSPRDDIRGRADRFCVPGCGDTLRGSTRQYGPCECFDRFGKRCRAVAQCE